MRASPPMESLRPPAFVFQQDDVLVNFGYPGEQELRCKRNRAIYLRLYPPTRISLA